MPISPKAPTFGAGAKTGENKISIREKASNFGASPDRSSGSMNVSVNMKEDNPWPDDAH